MKKHYFSYLLILLITCSCENVVLDEDTHTEDLIETRSQDSSDPEIFGQYNTLFKYIESVPAPVGNQRMTGIIETYSEGVEYDFELSCSSQNHLRVRFTANGALTIQDGKQVSSIYGVNGKQIKFTLSFLSGVSECQLIVENQISDLDQYCQSRLVFAGARYKGKPIYASMEGCPDLNVQARFYESSGGGSYKYHWTCNRCGGVWSNSYYNCPVCYN